MLKSLLEILTIKRIQTFYRSIDLHSVANAVRERIFSTTKWNIVNQLGKHNFPCGYIFFL